MRSSEDDDPRTVATVEIREACRACAITFAVPATFAFVRAGHIERARHYLAVAGDTASPPSRAGAWNAAIAELEAHEVNRHQLPDVL